MAKLYYYVNTGFSSYLMAGKTGQSLVEPEFASYLIYNENNTGTNNYSKRG